MWYIAHHGIKGQKWGTKNGPPYPLTYGDHSASEKKTGFMDSIFGKYQDKNGNLTQKGYEKFNDILEKNKRNYTKHEETDLYFKQFGMERQSDGSYKIKKGSNFQRITGEQETVDKKRKYVSITDFDNENYKELSNYLRIKGNDKYTENYQTKKDLKVASSEQVMDYLINKYGDTKISDLYGTDKMKENIKLMNKSFAKMYEKDLKRIEKFKDQTIADMYVDYGKYNYRDIAKAGMMANSKDKVLYERFDLGSKVATKLVQKVGNKDAGDIDKHFLDLGYDAIVDVEDKMGGAAAAPIILLNPEKSVKKTSSKKW